MASSPWPRGARIAVRPAGFMPRPLQSPEIVCEIWRDEFLGAAYEWGGLFNLTCHPR